MLFSFLVSAPRVLYYSLRQSMVKACGGCESRASLRDRDASTYEVQVTEPFTSVVPVCSESLLDSLAVCCVTGATKCSAETRTGGVAGSDVRTGRYLRRAGASADWLFQAAKSAACI